MTVFNLTRVYALSEMNRVLALSTFVLSLVAPALNFVCLFVVHQSLMLIPKQVYIYHVE